MQATPETSGTDGNGAQIDQATQNNFMYVGKYPLIDLPASCYSPNPTSNQLSHH